ncbi:MAG: hypothetical protein PHC43_02520 [Candidatus Marinimicrobia bacterium]|nr:hypothetical protein [Candidatus Neomarinimicrobiota bacterium]
MKKNRKSGRKKNSAQKSFTVPFDVAILILAGILIFIMFTLAYRSCTKSDNQLEELKVNIEITAPELSPEGELL